MNDRQGAISRACHEFQSLYKETSARRGPIEIAIVERFHEILASLEKEGVDIEKHKIPKSDIRQPQVTQSRSEVPPTTFQHRLQTVMLELGCDFPSV